MICVSAKLTLNSGINIDYQRSNHILATALDTIIAWHSFWDPRILLHPLRPIIQRYYGRIFKRYVRRELDDQFGKMKNNLDTNASRRSHSIIHLALEASKSGVESHEPKLNDEFADILTNQIRLFLFVGKDTTSSSIAFMYHLLSKHPQVLLQLQREHSAVFGPDASQAAALIKAQPTLLNQCRYTLAVIQETLRLYPPAANIRQGMPDLTTLSGACIPTSDFYIIVNHHAMHQNPRLWVKGNN